LLVFLPITKGWDEDIEDTLLIKRHFNKPILILKFLKVMQFAFDA